MTTRRGFLLGCLALGAAPAIVRASSLMPARVLEESRLVIPITGPSLAEILQETFRLRAPQMAANIARNNALLITLMGGGGSGGTEFGLRLPEFGLGRPE